MAKWLLIGVVCAFYRLFLEDHLLAAIRELQDVFFLMKSRRRAQPVPRTRAEVFAGGFIAALIVFFWPLYLLIAAGKLLGFLSGASKTYP